MSAKVISVPAAVLALLAIILILPACRASSSAVSPPDSTEAGVRVVRPGAPGDSSRLMSYEELLAASRPAYTEADVAFMQSMIPHHAQALEMTALVQDRSDSADFLRLARRIEISQRDEILLMQTWLQDRGESVPGKHAHHGHDNRMPGMLTVDEMAQLRNSTGSTFETLFLKYMISHHEGALVMVRELFSSRGAAQDSEIYRFASDVDTDQRMEIARMSAMLGKGR